MQAHQTASPASSGSIKFTSKQLNRGLERLKERKKARKKARDEEKCYVEYKKQLFLASNQPSVGALRSGDEVFPKRRRGSMGFGERKAHFLAIRPRPIYATWIGRKTGIVEAKAPSVPQPVQFTDHSSMPDVTGPSDSARQSKEKKTGDNAARVVKAERLENEISPVAETPVQEQVEKRFGNKHENPLVGSTPFWTIQSGNETDEVTDEDLPVDMDILERVCNGDLTLSQRPFQKTKFYPFASTHRFKFDDVLFARDSTLFTSTIEAVITLQPDEDINYPVHPPIQRLIKWNNVVQVIHFDPANRKNSLEPAVAEELKDIRREKGDKK